MGGGATDAWAQQTVRVLGVRKVWCVQGAGCGLERWVGGCHTPEEEGLRKGQPVFSKGEVKGKGERVVRSKVEPPVVRLI